VKRWIAFTASLYPRTWREQFADEFAALLDDVKPGWRVFANVLGGAIRMQITAGSNWIKLVATTAVLGAIVASGVSFTVSRDYVSTAVVSITPQPDPVRPESTQTIQQRAADGVQEIQDEILSRTSLYTFLSDPKFDLYKKERRRKVIEEVIDEMRGNIRIEARPSRDGGLSPIILDISFAYPDQVKAQAVVRELENRFARASLTADRERDNTYRSFWHDQSVFSHAKPAPPPPLGDFVVGLNPASLPKESPGPSRVAYLIWGLGVGLLLGLLAVFAMRWPRGILQLSGFAAAGCILAGAASFLIPNRYMSTAVMRITPAELMEDPLTPIPPATPAAQFLRQVDPQILSFQNLSTMIQDPRLDLYKKERRRKPMEEVVRSMLTRDLRISALNPGSNGEASAFTITFSYSEKHKARQVVQSLLTKFLQEHLNRKSYLAESAKSEKLNQIFQRKAGEMLEVLDSPSLPEKPVSPNRLAIAGAGLGGGLLLGAIALCIRHPRIPALQPA